MYKLFFFFFPNKKFNEKHALGYLPCTHTQISLNCLSAKKKDDWYSKYTVSLNLHCVSQCNLLVKYSADTERDRGGGTMCLCFFFFPFFLLFCLLNTQLCCSVRWPWETTCKYTTRADTRKGEAEMHFNSTCNLIHIIHVWSAFTFKGHRALSNKLGSCNNEDLNFMF